MRKSEDSAYEYAHGHPRELEGPELFLAILIFTVALLGIAALWIFCC